MELPAVWRFFTHCARCVRYFIYGSGSKKGVQREDIGCCVLNIRNDLMIALCRCAGDESTQILKEREANINRLSIKETSEVRPPPARPPDTLQIFIYKNAL
jgi:hypothetical protein